MLKPTSASSAWAPPGSRNRRMWVQTISRIATARITTPVSSCVHHRRRGGAASARSAFQLGDRAKVPVARQLSEQPFEPDRHLDVRERIATEVGERRPASRCRSSPRTSENASATERRSPRSSSIRRAAITIERAASVSAGPSILPEAVRGTPAGELLRCATSGTDTSASVSRRRSSSTAGSHVR